MSEELRAPIQIAPNLAAGVQINGHWITVEYSELGAVDSRTQYRWTVIFPDNSEESGDDLFSGYQGGDLTKGLASLLTFMGACGESMRYGGNEGENASLFPPRVAAFCAEHEDEIGRLQIEIEEPWNDANSDSDSQD